MEWSAEAWLDANARPASLQSGPLLGLTTVTPPFHCIVYVSNCLAFALTVEVHLKIVFVCRKDHQNVLLFEL